MLSWSSDNAGETADLASIASGETASGIELGDELLRFASACAGRDDDELAVARTALVEASDEAFMVDAAAIACNFEMMTRLADSTGARMPDDVLDRRAAAIEAMGVATVTSRR